MFDLTFTVDAQDTTTPLTLAIDQMVIAGWTGRGCSDVIGSSASTASIVAQQATVRASGPMLSRLDDSGTAPSSGTRRCVGL